MKQTAVEFFAEELNKWRAREFGENAIIGIPIEVIEEANKLFEEQIKDAWDVGKDSFSSMSAEQYYNKTFKSEPFCNCPKGKGIDFDENQKAYCIDCGKNIINL